MQIDHDSILTLELPYREQLQLHRTVFHGGRRAARSRSSPAFTATSSKGCTSVTAWRRGSRSWRRTRPDALRGRVELYPALNPLGIDTLQRFVPVFDTDLNRNFPGHREGLLPQRITEAVMRALAGAALVLDIHASNVFLREIPQVRINQEFGGHAGAAGARDEHRRHLAARRAHGARGDDRPQPQQPRRSVPGGGDGRRHAHHAGVHRSAA